MKFARNTILVSLLVVGIWGSIFAYFLFYDTVPSVFVPDIKNLSSEEGIEELKKANLRYSIEYVSGDNNNVIISTNPEVNTKVKEESLIKVFVSKYDAPTWDDYTKQTLSEIKPILEEFTKANAVTFSISYEIDNSYAEGVIMKQSIMAGSEVKEGENIVLTVAKNDNYFLLPDFVGMSEDECFSFLNEKRITFFTIYESSYAPTGTILEQSIVPNTYLLEGNQSTIILKISRGLFLE